MFTGTNLNILFLIRKIADSVEYTDEEGNVRQDHIGAQIPPSYVATVELVMDDIAQKEHNKVYGPLIALMKNVYGSRAEQQQRLSDGQALSSDGTGTRDFGITRRLNQAAFSYRLELMTQRTKKNLSADIQKWNSLYADHGATLLFAKTCLDRDCMPPSDNRAMKRYVGGSNVKLQYLSRCVLEVTVNGKAKILIYGQHVMSVWQTFSFLEMTGIKIGPGHQRIRERQE